MVVWFPILFFNYFDSLTVSSLLSAPVIYIHYLFINNLFSIFIIIRLWKVCWYYFYKKRILFYKVHLRCQRPFNLQVFRKKSAIKPAIEALLGLKASMNAWSASLFKRRRPLCLPLPLQTVRYFGCEVSSRFYFA